MARRRAVQCLPRLEDPCGCLWLILLTPTTLFPGPLSLSPGLSLSLADDQRDPGSALLLLVPLLRNEDTVLATSAAVDRIVRAQLLGAHERRDTRLLDGTQAQLALVAQAPGVDVSALRDREVVSRSGRNTGDRVRRRLRPGRHVGDNLVGFGDGRERDLSVSSV